MAFLGGWWELTKKWFDRKRKADASMPVSFANECSGGVANLTALAIQDEGAEKRLFSLYIKHLTKSVWVTTIRTLSRWLHGLSQTKSFILQSFDTLATLSIFRILKVIIFCFNCKFMRRFFLFAIGTNYLTFIISFHNLSVL